MLVLITAFVLRSVQFANSFRIEGGTIIFSMHILGGMNAGRGVRGRDRPEIPLLLFLPKVFPYDSPILGYPLYVTLDEAFAASQQR